MQGWDYTNHVYRDVAVDGAARQLVTPLPSYVGLSTDAKPFSTSSLALVVGMSFWETDTGRTYVWDGAAWRLLGSEWGAVAGLLGLLLLELQRIRLIVETITS